MRAACGPSIDLLPNGEGLYECDRLSSDLSPNGDEPVRVRPDVLRLTFPAMVIDLYGCSHISLG